MKFYIEGNGIIVNTLNVLLTPHRIVFGGLDWLLSKAKDRVFGCTDPDCGCGSVRKEEPVWTEQEFIVLVKESKELWANHALKEIGYEDKDINIMRGFVENCGGGLIPTKDMLDNAIRELKEPNKDTHRVAYDKTRFESSILEAWRYHEGNKVSAQVSNPKPKFENKLKMVRL